MRVIRVFILLGSLLVCGCGASDHYAPVADVSSLVKQRQQRYKPRMLATVRAPVVKTFVAKRQIQQTRYVAESKPAVTMYPVRDKTLEWQWPAQGKITKAYSANSKGIDITNRLGEPIYAAKAGRVVYSGNGIKGYGNLIIIKHNQAYMTTYAHNSRVYVKSGQFVAKGQKIAEMGKSGSRQVKLYFQVRYHGRPVNPSILF